MYDIGIPEIICKGRYEDLNHKSIKYNAVARNRPKVCTNEDCPHKHNLHIHSTSTNLIRDIRSEGKLIFINLSVRRYRCPDCGNHVCKAYRGLNFWTSPQGRYSKNQERVFSYFLFPIN